MIFPKSLLMVIVMPAFLLSDNYRLTEIEKKSIAMANEWINNNTKIIKQKDGSLAFYYGDNMPSLICKPLNATVIKLQEGEKIEGIKSGDPQRWKFDAVEADRSFVLVKPTEPNIMTNLIIFTNRRIYNIKLISTKDSWIPGISFIYGDSAPKQETNTSPIPNQKTTSKASVPASISTSEYIISSDGWKPNDIYTKHGKTYISLNDISPKNLPRLFIINQNKNTQITYTYKNQSFVVNGIIQKAILVKDDLTKTIIHIRRRK